MSPVHSPALPELRRTVNVSDAPGASVAAKPSTTENPAGTVSPDSVSVAVPVFLTG